MSCLDLIYIFFLFPRRVRGRECAFRASVLGLSLKNQKQLSNLRILCEKTLPLLVQIYELARLPIQLLAPNNYYRNIGDRQVVGVLPLDFK